MDLDMDWPPASVVTIETCRIFHGGHVLAGLFQEEKYLPMPSRAQVPLSHRGFQARIPGFVTAYLVKFGKIEDRNEKFHTDRAAHPCMVAPKQPQNWPSCRFWMLLGFRIFGGF